MSFEKIKNYLTETAKEFGAKEDGNKNQYYVFRSNLSTEALNHGGAFFGIIQPQEEASGQYHDFSLVIFPCTESKGWVVSLGVGIAGFKNDYELSTYPGLQRLFAKLVDERGYCKSEFSDIETGLPKSFINQPDLKDIKNTLKIYSKYISACQIIDDPNSAEGKKIIRAFLASYSKVREWPSNDEQRKAVDLALHSYLEGENEGEDIAKIKELVLERKYVVLQGAPGTGKTFTAKEVSKALKADVFFIQFHAETSYSDFVYGIRPNINGKDLNYVQHNGELLRAVKFATENSNKNVILIIDEINRANLSNVLGPVFYLFEHKMQSSEIRIELAPDLSLSQLPQNFYVIATMNTADRSIAVVDFALRRRFAWYTLKPKIIQEKAFFKADFLKIQEIFDWYAKKNELALQPGQGYFLAENEAEMQNRIRFEIFPLIDEYLQEGILQNAKEEFNIYFSKRIKHSLT